MITTRGMKEAQCRDLSSWIADILDAMQAGDAEASIAEVKIKVRALCAEFPAYG